MNRYQPTTPRLAFALVALALTAATIGLAGVAPAAFDSGYRQDVRVLARNAGAAPIEVAIEVAIVPAKIEVIAVRGKNVASGAPNEVKPRG